MQTVVACCAAMTNRSSCECQTAGGGGTGALIRVVVRLTRGVPAEAGRGLIDRLGALGHRVLYALMIAVPALGAIS